MKNPPTGSAGGVGKREYLALALTKKEQSELTHSHSVPDRCTVVNAPHGQSGNAR